MVRYVPIPPFCPDICCRVSFAKISLLILVLTVSLASSVGADCPEGDLNEDCIVNFQDLLAFAGEWLGDPGSSANLNGDDAVDIADFARLAKNWRVQETSLIISEFMAIKKSFFDTLVEGEWVNPDWIEIHNTTDQQMSLDGWYLTDNKNNLTKWQFPSGVTIDFDGYRVVFVSNKKYKWYPGNYPYVDELGYLHTNFELRGDGEYLALVRSDGVTVAHAYAPTYPEQRAFVSYGYCSGSDEYGYFLNPTPGTQNDTTCITNTNVVADTKFSVDRGIYDYDTPLDVVITCATQDATIRYTTDGSEPTMSNGNTYNNTPIHITATTCLRAAAFKTDWLPTNVDTQTYIFLNDVILQDGAGFPDTWSHLLYITGEADYEMDPIVVGDYSSTIKKDLKAVPTLSLVMNVDDWFDPYYGAETGIYSHPEWEDDPYPDELAERRVSAELIDPCGTLGEFQIDAAVRLAGGTSTIPWKMDKLSMRLKFREPHGPTKLNFPLFGDEAADSFDTLVLDARMNNSWAYGGGVRPHGTRPYYPEINQRDIAQYTRDQFVSDIHNAMGGYSPHGRHVHLYLNGLYWGLYWVHERPDDAFATSYFGGEKDDYDCLKHDTGDIVSGTNANYNEMFSIANAGLSSSSQYQLIQQYLDVPNLIDYMITNFYVGNSDWAHQNWYATRSRIDPNSRWRYHSWDAEHVMEGLYEDVTSKDNSGGPTRLHQRLMANTEYQILFADHVHRHFFNDGVLTSEGAAALYQIRLDEVDRAVVGESARWGDNRIMDKFPFVRYTRDEHWVLERDWMLYTYLPQRTDEVLNQLKMKGWYPNVKAPSFSPHGGWHPGAFYLTITNLNGSGYVYCTLDGADPRIGTGFKYTAAFEVPHSTIVKARALDVGTWSALNEAIYAVGPVKENLRITEIMYHPQDTNDPNDPNEEFIELKNIGTELLNLNLVSFTRGIDFTFRSLELPGGQYVLVVKNQAAFEAQYPGFSGVIAGEYIIGRLANDGERIRLQDAIGQTIQDFRYRDGWYDITDGGGFSLTIKDPNSTDPNDWGSKSGWRPSAKVGGSPGWDDTGDVPELGSVKINELLAHSHTVPSDWIELHNTTSEPINIGGWFLSDNDNNFMKYEIAENTIIDPCGYIVFYENQHFDDLNDPGCHVRFRLSENGETLYLHSGQGGVLTGYSEEELFGASWHDVAFGRYRKSTGTYNFVAMSENTPGYRIPPYENAYPKVEPIVINEIMYHPEPEGDAEYVELYNWSGSTVELQEYDNEQLIYVPWRFTDSDGSITFDFPLGTTMDPGEYLLIVKNKVIFNDQFPGVPGGVQIFEWGSGKLNNGGEKIQLSKPGDEVEGTRYYIRVDRVVYSDGVHPPGEDPWPPEPDGGGSSLARKAPADYGNDVINWKAATPPSPGGP